MTALISIGELEACLAASTSGEWYPTNGICIVDVGCRGPDGKLKKIVAVCNMRPDDDGTDEEHANASIIAASHNAAPALIAIAKAALGVIATHDDNSGYGSDAWHQTCFAARRDLRDALSKVCP